VIHASGSAFRRCYRNIPPLGGSRDFRDFVIEFALPRLPDLG
jgi:hypothetical protein